MYSTSVRITPPFPINLRNVVSAWKRGNSDPLTRTSSNPDALWTTTAQGSTNIIVRFHQKKAEASTLAETYLAPIDVRLWSERTSQALTDIETALSSMHRWVGTLDNWETFEKSAAWRLLPPSLIRSRQEHPGGVRLGATGEVFKNAVASITEQRVTGIEAMGGLRAILRQTTAPVPATGLADQPQGPVFFPSPAIFASLPSWVWHRAGYDRARSATIVELARRAPSIEKIGEEQSSLQLARALASIRGIGP